MLDTQQLFSETMQLLKIIFIHKNLTICSCFVTVIDVLSEVYGQLRHKYGSLMLYQARLRTL